MRMLYLLVVAMFFILLLSISSGSKLTILVALGLVGSFMFALVDLARDRWLDSDRIIDTHE
jgi:hypothetical protein